MSRIIIPQRRVWTRPTERPVSEDCGHSLLRDAEVIFPGAKNPLTVFGSPKSVQTEKGKLYNGVDGAVADRRRFAFAQHSGDFSVTFIAVNYSNTTYATIAGWQYYSSSPTVFGVFCISMGKREGTYAQSGGFEVGFLPTTTAYSDPVRVGTPYNEDGSSYPFYKLGVPRCVSVACTGSSSSDVTCVVDGVKQTNISRSGAIPSASPQNRSGIGLGGEYASPDNTMGSFASGTGQGAIGLIILHRRRLSLSEQIALTQNPWQIFTRRDRRTIIDFGASGTTSVYADSALTYYIRSMLSSDSGVQYAIRNAIYKDDAVGYYLRASIAQNNEVGYILRSAIAQDDAEAYKIRGLIQADDAESYNVRGLVQTTDSETYSIRGQVQTDATANYDIQSSTSVASTSTASYSVRGSVASDGVSQYSVRSAIQSDSSAGYSVRASAYRDVVSSYAIDAAESVVYSDLTTSYSIDGVAPACPTADQIAAAVLAQLNATTIPVNVTHFNGNPTQGSGQPNDPVRPA